MTHPAHLHLATPEDLAAIEALINAAYAPYVARIGKKPGPMRDADDGQYSRYIEAGHIHLLRQDDEIVGLLVLIPRPDTLLLDNVAVAPGAQGRGFGRALMRAAEVCAREMGFDDITLYTQELMHENLAIYRRYGYVETHRVEERGLRRVYLRKSL